ncbi:HD domain-containing protein [Alicyclobacillus fastidiosus]|uniref:HD domain-containing protein n=1 Tax=Alicyclobacillus fastidiosus TaxID=392011 RepID=A0ABY6ZIV7_9BACL|nr:HD domain-containing protein [Alicyclobacillus fastidiosus]WAH42766.1 HD domain-containing protein [Alicyclobacillus fastidiosus]GMA64678.1 phosphohydrolase [Alicyclobacillus fastidiosus]
MDAFHEYRNIAKKHASSDPAHDYLHVVRVYHNARQILLHERADSEIVLVGALLHELFNYPKDHPLSHQSGDVAADMAFDALPQTAFPMEKRERVCEIIRNHAFSKGIIPDTIEGKILQDADRLDAIGAIGLARLFATSGSLARPLYSPDDAFCRNRRPEGRMSAVDHVFEKLLHIPETLHTAAARALAKPRMAFISAYLHELREEIL